MNIFRKAAEEETDVEILDSVMNAIHSLACSGGTSWTFFTKFIPTGSKMNSYLTQNNVIDPIRTLFNKGNERTKFLAAESLYNIAKDGDYKGFLDLQLR